MTTDAVPFEITDPTRDALAGWPTIRGRRDDDWLFASRSRPGIDVLLGRIPVVPSYLLAIRDD